MAAALSSRSGLPGFHHVLGLIPPFPRRHLLRGRPGSHWRRQGPIAATITGHRERSRNFNGLADLGWAAPRIRATNASYCRLFCGSAANSSAGVSGGFEGSGVWRRSKVALIAALGVGGRGSKARRNFLSTELVRVDLSLGGSWQHAVDARGSGGPPG